MRAACAVLALAAGSCQVGDRCFRNSDCDPPGACLDGTCRGGAEPDASLSDAAAPAREAAAPLPGAKDAGLDAGDASDVRPDVNDTSTDS